MVVVVSSGSDYSSDFMRGYDFVESYLRAIFGFVGITDITFFHAQAMDVSPEVRKAGQKTVIAEARAFVRSGAWRPARPAPALAATPPPAVLVA